MIYCVEDEKNIRELLVYTLETTGFTAKGLADGKELCAAMKKELPSLILLDIMLPGEDGYGILTRLKSSPDTKNIPVIMVTAKEAEFDYFTTTLTISPMKNAEKLNTIGAKIGEKYGVKYLQSDFKKKNGYKRSIELSNEFGLYRQDYCGCEFSVRDRKQESTGIKKK